MLLSRLGLPVTVMAVALAGCAPSLSFGAPCDLSSDCTAPYVCRHERCRTACREARDCGPGLRCVVDGQGLAVCTFEQEETCSAASPCPGGLRCVDGECRTECGGIAICTAAGSCVDGTCVEPSVGSDAGVTLDAAGCTPVGTLTCSDGLVQRCDLDFGEVARVLTGGVNGEAAPLAAHTVTTVDWPADGATPARPEIAVALSRAGFGIVLYLTGATRELVAHDFSTRDHGDGTPITITRRDFGAPPPPITNALSFGLAENGDQIVGFVLNLTPTMAGGLSGHELTFRSDRSGSERPIGAGDPPAVTGGRVAILGGLNANLGTDEPIFYLTREIFQPSGPPVLGAVDEDLSMDTYRATDTTRLSAAPFLDSSGSAGALALFRGGGTEIALWRVPMTAPLRGGMPADDLMIHDLGARGEPSIAFRGDIDYAVAVPVEVGGFGYTRFFEVVCRTGLPCNAPVMVGADLQTRAARIPLAVRLMRMPRGGWAMATLEALPGTDRGIYVRVLDDNFVPVGTEPELLFSTTGDETIVAIDAASTSTSANVHVVVAALVRNATRGRDRVVLTGLDACIER